VNGQRDIQWVNVSGTVVSLDPGPWFEPTMHRAKTVQV
jgi:hypothetical protein